MVSSRLKRKMIGYGFWLYSLVLGGYLVFHGMGLLRACDKKIETIKKQSKFIDDLMVE